MLIIVHSAPNGISNLKVIRAKIMKYIGNGLSSHGSSPTYGL
jgi:hypothetical protein